ncbi:hypothetical protein [Porphyromonas somerae]|uniref:hypothetical protein n=1 Tax=Porphyromonas somerae TaxID=322095 RepID=UPI001FCAFB72|nr:hypothetical protein [Porphyromonas somerae]
MDQSVFFPVAFFLLIGLVVAIYMVVPKKTLKKIFTKKKLVNEVTETSNKKSSVAGDKKEKLQQSIPKEKAHWDIIGKSKTNIADYVYTLGEGIENDDDDDFKGINVTPEELAQKGISSDELNEDTEELWDSAQVLDSEQTVTLRDYNAIVNSMFNNSLTEDEMEVAQSAIEKLAGTDFLANINVLVQNKKAQEEEVNQRLFSKMIELQNNISSN